MRELLAQRTRFNSRFFRALIVADQIKLSWVINSCWLWKTCCVVSLCGVWLRSDLPTPYFFIMVVTASFTFLNVSSAFRAVVLMAKPRSTFSETQTYNVTLCYKVFTKRLQIRRRTLFKVVTEEYRVEKWNYIATKKFVPPELYLSSEYWRSIKELENWYLRESSHLVPGHGARVRYSLGANVNTPFFFKVPTLEFGCRAGARVPGLNLVLGYNSGHRLPVCKQFLYVPGSPLLCSRC